jgi:hypothetical protein
LSKVPLYVPARRLVGAALLIERPLSIRKLRDRGSSLRRNRRPPGPYGRPNLRAL